MSEDKKEQFMLEAIAEAKKALQYDEVPVGAIIVKDDIIVARAHNMRETSQVSINHAEIIAIHEACKTVGSWRLVDCEMYVTLEPCIMCAGALILSRLKKVYFGAYDKKAGAVVNVDHVLDNEKYNHMVTYEGGVLEEECSELLKAFFKKLRRQKND